MFMHNSGAMRGENAESYPPSFRDAPLGAGPESILPVTASGAERKHRGYGFRARARARPGM